MLEKVDMCEIRNISSFWDDTQLKMVLSSIGEGYTEGELWSSDKEKSKTYFLWDKGNIVFYLFGKPPSSRCLKRFFELFKKDIINLAKEDNLSHFKFNNLTDMSDKSIKDIFGDREFRILDRSFYGFDKETIEGFDSSLDDLKILDIDEGFLKNTERRNLAQVINEVKWMWPSFQKYYKNGFGKAGVVKDEIVCWCTAEYVSRGMCGIGIKTLDRYQKKGIATKTASEFIRYCLKNDIKPYWECGASNTPSVKLAEKLGFDKIDEYQVWLGKF